MDSHSNSAYNKKSLMAVGVLMLSLAALQSPLWRSPVAGTAVAVRNGGATLIASERPISGVAVDPSANVTAEVVGNYEVLVRGNALGETQLSIVSKDGSTRKYRVIVQPESSRSLWGSLGSR